MEDFSLRVYDPLAAVSSWISGSVSRNFLLPAFRRDVTQDLSEGFQRSIADFGPDKGMFVMEGDNWLELFSLFDNWIGSHVVEWTAGSATWEGFIYMMDIVYKGHRDRRALLGVPTHEQMWNRVAAIYRAPSTNGNPELVSNPSFELPGAGGADVFDSWAETAGGGTISQYGPIKHNGNYSVRMVDGGIGDTYVSQYYSLQVGKTYKLSFYTRGNGTYDGRYRVYDEVNKADIISYTNTGVTGTTFTLVEVDFTVPTDGTTVRIDLGPRAAGTGSTVYFDDVSLKEYTDQQLETSFAQNDKSVARYGKKEIKIDVGVMNLTNAEAARDLYLSERAWPYARTVATAESKAFDSNVRLEIYVCGYYYTLNYRYVSPASSWVKLNAKIKTIIDNDCEFINIIKTSTDEDAYMLMVANITDTNIINKRAGTAIEYLVESGDTSTRKYRFYILPGRNAVYELLNLNPKYYRRGAEYSTNIGGTIKLHPRKHWPGVVRRMDYPVSGKEQGALLLDRRDMLIDEFIVTKTGEVNGRVRTFAESEVIKIEDQQRPSSKWKPPIGTDGGQVFDVARDLVTESNNRRRPNSKNLSFSNYSDLMNYLRDLLQ